MAVTESNLWDWLAKARLVLGLDLDMRRVENAVGIGDPDVELCYKGAGADIELKAARRPAHLTTKLKFGSPMKDDQVEWAVARLRAGGAHGYLIQVGSGAERAIYLVHGNYGRHMLDFGVTEGWLMTYGRRFKDPAEAVKHAVRLHNTREGAK